jgi:hypothetical protein
VKTLRLLLPRKFVLPFYSPNLSCCPHQTDCIYLDTSLQLVHIINEHRLWYSHKHYSKGPNRTWVISDGAA